LKKIHIVSLLVTAAAGVALLINRQPSSIEVAPSPVQGKSESSAVLERRDINELSFSELEAEIGKIKEVIDKEKLVDVVNDPNEDENRKKEAKRILRYRLDLATRKIDLHLSYLETQFAKGQ
jgi:hypothetical protein